MPLDKYSQFKPLKRTWRCEKCGFEIKRDSQINKIEICSQCGGKFVPTDTIERDLPDPDSELRWIVFLDTRKGNGKDQFMELQSFILTEEDRFDGGWVPLVEIENFMKKQFPNLTRQRLLNLLRDMVQFEILRKKKELDQSTATPNKYRSYYRYSPFTGVGMKTDEGVKKDYGRLLTQYFVLVTRFGVAQNVLRRHGLIQEFDADLKNERYFE